MAISATISLDALGIETQLPAYIGLQNIMTQQLRHPESGRVFWKATASVLAYASRDAKHAGKLPIETSHIESEFDPAVTSAFDALYTALKNVPRFAGAVDA